VKKVLFIDDDHHVLDLLEVYLCCDYEIVTALNGFEGLKLADELVPYFIITDIMMPVLDGIKFLNNLRKQPKTAHIPVIAITSFAKKLNVKSLLHMGFNGVIAKPINREALLKVITTALA